MLFCIIITVINPLITVFNFVSGYNAYIPYFNHFPGLLKVFIIDFVLCIALTSISIYAGISLWMIRTNAVKIAKIYLLVFLCYSILGIFLPFMTGLQFEGSEVMIVEVVKAPFAAFIFIAIWYSYLNKSKRVKATYET